MSRYNLLSNLLSISNSSIIFNILFKSYKYLCNIDFSYSILSILTFPMFSFLMFKLFILNFMR